MPLRIITACVACYIANILTYSASAGLAPHVLTELELSHRAGVQALTNHTWNMQPARLSNLSLQLVLNTASLYNY